MSVAMKAVAAGFDARIDLEDAVKALNASTARIP